MNVLLLSSRPFGAADIDRVLLTGLQPAAVDVCPSVDLALARLDTLAPDLIVVNLPEPEAAEAVARLRERRIQTPAVVVTPLDAAILGGHQSPPLAARPLTAVDQAPMADLEDLLTREEEPPDEAIEARLTDAALAQARDELERLTRRSVTDALDAETRWLLYDVASIGHLSTTPEGDILAANDVAAQLLGHFSSSTLEAAGRMPQPLLDAAGAYAQRPSRFELCLQHGEEGPLHWIVGLGLPQSGVPATVTWFLIDVSEQRLQTRRQRFLRRMESLTHVLTAATAECATLVDAGNRALATARVHLAEDVDVEQALRALSRTQAVLGQLAGFARRRARRPALRDVRLLLERVSPVLVHVTGEDVTWALELGETPLFASLDQVEFEQCLTALATQAREALPLGGQIRLTLDAVLNEAPMEENRSARPELELRLELQGYGLQPVPLPSALQTQVLRLGADLTVHQPDHLTTRLVLRLPRVFVTA